MARKKQKHHQSRDQGHELKSDGPVIQIQYFRSYIAAPQTHKTIVQSLGLRKLNQIVTRPDTPAMRGFVAKVPHLLRIVE